MKVIHLCTHKTNPTGGSKGGAASMPLQQDPILSFSQTFLPKSTHVGGQCPPKAQCPPQQEIMDLPLQPIQIFTVK